VKSSAVLILDDVVPTARAIGDRLIKECGNQLSVECFHNEAEFKIRLDEFDDEQHQPVLIVNAAFRPFPHADSRKSIGLERVVKQGLRVSWLKRNPVIVYGPMSETEIRETNIGKIFNATDSHKYFEIGKLNDERGFSFKKLLESITPVADDESLRLLINEFCLRELRDRLVSVKHNPLSKMHKLDSEGGRRQLLASLDYLQRAVSGGHLNQNMISDGIRLIKNFREERRSKVEARLKLIRGDVESLIGMLGTLTDVQDTLH
jgi:hypothetical protein